MSAKSKQFNSTSDNVIIQCPKCQTKFSVSSELISELELPRFHCSRCDNVFDMDPRTDANLEESDIKNAVKETPEAAKQKDLFGQNEPPQTDFKEAAFEEPELPKAPDAREEIKNASTMEVSREELKQIRNALKSHEEISKDEIKRFQDDTQEKEPDPFSFQAGPEELKKDFELIPNKNVDVKDFILKDPPQKETKSLEIPKSYSPEKPASPPIENQDDVGPKSGQLSMDLDKSGYSSDQTEESMPYGISYGNPFDTVPRPVEQDLAPPSFSIERLEPLTTRRGGWSALAVFFMPIFLTLFCACIMSIVLVRSPEIAEALANNLGVNLPKFAPPGLYIENIKFNKVTLNNGAAVYAISGNLKNDSTSKFNTITLEGFAFDGSGEIIAANKANAATGLDLERIAPLSVDTILDAQLQNPPKRYELEPGTRQDFLVVLQSGGESSEPVYFSARIHSVS